MLKVSIIDSMGYWGKIWFIEVSRSSWGKSDKIFYYRKILSFLLGLLQGFGSSIAFYLNVDKLKEYLTCSLAPYADSSM